ncbi:hypothetical protein [Nitrospira sp. M1]
MNQRSLFFRHTILRKISIFVGLIVFCVLPFSGALEIHHVFAEVDHDGHEHSDFDVCQWVQQHASGLFVFERPLADALPLDITQEPVDHDSVIPSFFQPSCQSPRPPPSS